MSMNARVRELVEQGDRLFEKKRPLHNLWQTMAEHFYPMRADFTVTRRWGEEFASHLTTGRPMLAHRDLGNALSSMLRPRATPWFHARTADEQVNEDAGARQWLDAKAAVMRRAMYDPRSQFIRATKQGDNDFVCFGQTVIQVSPNRHLDGILYRTWHLRDCAWCENAELVIDVFHRDWKIEARDYMRLFPANAAAAIRSIAHKEPYREIKCRHIVLPAEEYDAGGGEGELRRNKLPFVSLYVDCENDTLLEAVPQRRLGYVIPRWVTPSGSQYAHSPATVVALPDARMLQQMTLTILEAGQKAVDPPLKATREAIVGGVNAYAGGLTWVDAEYDEKLGAALEPLLDVSPGLAFGERREEKIEALINEAFFLNQIALPDLTAGDMTAYEVQKRVEEYIRRALPLFEPMEAEYNGGLCEETWNLCMEQGTFGALDDMPPILRGREIDWQFEVAVTGGQRARQGAGLHAIDAIAGDRGTDRSGGEARSRHRPRLPRRAVGLGRTGELDRTEGSGRYGEGSGTADDGDAACGRGDCDRRRRGGEARRGRTGAERGSADKKYQFRTKLEKKRAKARPVFLTSFQGRNTNLSICAAF